VERGREKAWCCCGDDLWRVKKMGVVSKSLMTEMVENVGGVFRELHDRDGGKHRGWYLKAA
jgi:hypothetical protein